MASPQLEAIDQTPFDIVNSKGISISVLSWKQNLEANPMQMWLVPDEYHTYYIPLLIALKQSTLRPRSSFLGTSIRPTSKICNQNIINTSPFSLWAQTPLSTTQQPSTIPTFPSSACILANMIIWLFSLLTLRN